jgi:hypothetical protein
MTTLTKSLGPFKDIPLLFWVPSCDERKEIVKEIQAEGGIVVKDVEMFVI